MKIWNEFTDNFSLEKINNTLACQKSGGGPPRDSQQELVTCEAETDSAQAGSMFPLETLWNCRWSSQYRKKRCYIKLFKI